MINAHTAETLKLQPCQPRFRLGSRDPLEGFSYTPIHPIVFNHLSFLGYFWHLADFHLDSSYWTNPEHGNNYMIVKAVASYHYRVPLPMSLGRLSTSLVSTSFFQSYSLCTSTTRELQVRVA